MNFNFFKSLTFRVTAILFFVFYVVIFALFYLQYSSIKNKHIEKFLEHSHLHFSSLNKKKILENPDFVKSLTGSIFLPFDETGNSLWEVIVANNLTSEILVNEYVYINNQEKNALLNIAPKTLEKIFIDQILYFVYRENYNNFSVYYISAFSTFSDYYHSLLDQAILLAFVTFLLFLGFSLYFSRLVVEPIRERNLSLSLYNSHLAHELKTPLSVIRSNLEMLELTDNKKFIISSREEILYLEKIIDSLLFLVRKNFSQKNFSEISVSEVIDEIILKNPEISVQKICKNPIFVLADQILIITLFENIFTNAKKYSSEKLLFINISDKFIEFKNPTTKNFSKKEIEKIQEIFYQSDASRSSEGYGIGIPMMKKIVEVFGWRIEFSSKDNNFIVKIFYKKLQKS